MKKSPRRLQIAFLLFAALSVRCNAQTSPAELQSVSMLRYSVELSSGDRSGNPPQLKLEREHQIVFQMPIVAGLSSASGDEKLSDIVDA